MAYLAGDVLVRAVMQAASGLPQDQIVNDFAFHGATAPDMAQIEDLCDLVSAFYRDVNTNGMATSRFISNQVNRAATHELQAWMIHAGDLGSPVFTKNWLGPITSSTANAGPTEVAAVLSFHAELAGVLEESGATRPRARRRGRIYFGPLNSDATESNTPPYPLNSQLTDTLAQAAVRLMTDAADTGYDWAVWSRADQTLRAVVGGWTDNAPDTQRRRGFKATVRATWG